MAQRCDPEVDYYANPFLFTQLTDEKLIFSAAKIPA
jgi:hypothetical protein